MKVIIAGGRDFNDYELLKKETDMFLKDELWTAEIVSGGAKGADKLGEQYARYRGLALTQFHADWSNGKQAGPIRNAEMADYADALIAFWDGKSRGTANMIQNAKNKGLIIKIVNY